MLPSTVAARMTAADPSIIDGRIEGERDAEDAWRQERRSDAIRNGNTGDLSCQPPPEEFAGDTKQQVSDGENQDRIPRTLSSRPRSTT